MNNDWNTEELEKAVAALEERKAALRALTRYRHAAYRVREWGPDSDKIPQEGAILSRDVAAREELGDVISSETVDDHTGKPTGMHTVVLDVDYRMAIRETSPGRGHLFIDVPPMSEKEYFALLEALAKARVIDRGYWLASVARGGSHVRTPWTPKERMEQVDLSVVGDPALEPENAKLIAAVNAEYARQMLADGVEPTDQKLDGLDAQSGGAPDIYRDADGVEWVEVEKPQIGDLARRSPWDGAALDDGGIVSGIRPDYIDPYARVVIDGDVLAHPARDYAFYRKVQGR